MGLDLLIVTCQGHIEEVFVFTKLSEGDTDIALKVVPAQAELVRRHFDCLYHFINSEIQSVLLVESSCFLWRPWKDGGRRSECPAMLLAASNAGQGRTGQGRAGQGLGRAEAGQGRPHRQGQGRAPGQGRARRAGQGSLGQCRAG